MTPARQQRIDGARDLREILLDAVLRHVGRHLQEQWFAVLRMRVPGLQLVGVLDVGKPAVVAFLVADVEEDHDARGHADREAHDVDDRVAAALRKRPNRDRPIIPPHAYRPLQHFVARVYSYRRAWIGLARATLTAWPTTVATAMPSAIAPAIDERDRGQRNPLVEAVQPVAHHPPGDRPGDDVGDDDRAG